MGLAGASTKRKITDDPRNTRWRNDTSAPGFKMLTAMGWTPESAALNPTTSAPAGRRALTSIPSAKDDTLGIGATPTTSASSVFAAFGSRAGLRFVTAGASDEVRRHRKTEGGEFASLLDRLNTSASASPAPEAPTASGEERPRKKTKRWRAEEDEVAVEEPVVIAAPLPIPLPARVSSRARHLAAKRMATSSPADLAGILGYELPVLSAVAVPTAGPVIDLPAPSVPPIQVAPDDEALLARAARKAARKAKRKAERAFIV